MPRPAVLPAGLDPVEEHGQVWLLDGSQCARHHGECSHTPEPHGPRRNGCDPPGWKLCAGRGGHHCLKHPLRDQSTLLCLLLANKDPGRHLRNAQPRGVPTGQHAGHPLCRHHVLYRRHRQLLFHGRPHERSPPGEPSLRARPPRVRGVPLVEYLHELLAVGGGAMPLGPSDPRSQGHRRHLPPGLAGLGDHRHWLPWPLLARGTDLPLLHGDGGPRRGDAGSAHQLHHPDLDVRPMDARQGPVEQDWAL
mmetsp:Transcript_35358/g.110212  ORF Transcript_35358/g.110212 Transcript_35358/m.110212 type:complete len:250 (-) Transcript_35358:457-1206(-)